MYKRMLLNQIRRLLMLSHVSPQPASAASSSIS
jgi:hypothetical protein